MSVRYFYFGRPKSGNHQGIITVAAEDDGLGKDKPATKVHFALALCAPADQFDKARARAQATGRLQSARAATSAVRTKQVRDPWTGEVKSVTVPRTDVHRSHLVELQPGETPAAGVCRHFNDHFVKGCLPRWCKNWRLLPEAMAVGVDVLKFVGPVDADTKPVKPSLDCMPG